MHRLSILLLSALAFSAVAATPTSPPNDQDLAYSLGASLGERLRQEMPDLQLDALVEGLRQAYQGQPPRIDKSRMQAILQQHEEQAAAAGAQAHTDLLLAAEKRFMATERGRAGVHELSEGVLYSELASGSGAQPKAGGRVSLCREIARRLGVRSEPAAAMVQPGFGHRGVAGGATADEDRRQMASSDPFGAGLRGRRGGRPDRALHPTGLRDRTAGGGRLTQACTAPSTLCAVCSTSIRQSSSSKRSCNSPPSLPSFSANRSGSVHWPFSQ